MKKIYLDYASTTPLDPRVLAAMKPYLQGKFGNPSSLHSFGQETMAALDKSRETLANLIGANFSEVVFTSSATEANNLVIRGLMRTVHRPTQTDFRVSPRKVGIGQRPRLIVSAIEHESVLETARDLEKDGVEVIYLPVNEKGLVDLKKLQTSLNERTILVSIMYANNETGVIQPITKISEIISEFRSSVNGQVSGVWPLFHSDATQAFQYLDCNVDELGVDLMTLSSHKIYGPKGAGALYVRTPRGQVLSPMATGGGQEFELRSGTENVPAIVGFAKAAELVISDQRLVIRRTQELRDYLWRGLKKIYPKAKLNGDPIKRLPNNLNVYFPGISAEEMLIKLDLNGIAISAGSACAARSLEPSHVLEAMGFKEPRAKNSLRFSLGRPTTKVEIDKVLQACIPIFARVRYSK